MLKKYIFIIYTLTFFLQAQMSLQDVENVLVAKRKYKNFAKYQNRVTYEQIKERLQYIQNSASLSEYFYLSNTSFKLYASADDKKNDRCVYELQLAQEEDVSFVTKKLKNMRIVIDPGHIGGKNYCFLERRYILMNPDVVNGRKDIHFNEGNLAFLTALHLKKLLEKKGAQVILTRDQIGCVPKFRKDFFSWLREDFHDALDKYCNKISDLNKREKERSWWLTRSDLSSLFRKFYNPIGLKLRAVKINSHKPDITIVIHYNAGGENNEYGQNIGSKDNFNMAFVPGSFLAGELKTHLARYEFLRLLISKDLHNSVALSRLVVEKFTEKLNVPPLLDSNKAVYLKKYCLQTKAPGVYARNLTLTRLVHGTICYGESLYQDNLKESIALATKDDKIEGVPVSHRVKQVAEAYFEAIIAYCED